MGFLHFSSRAKRAQKASERRKHHSTRAEYLLNDKTPFDVTEAFRNLKATLSVSVPKKEGGVAIMATSAYPEDGKTTVTVNLALMFAQSDAKVILVDADIRKGRVAKYFKKKSSPGLSDCLSGQNTLDEVIHKAHINENLSYITCGTHSPRPYELLESEEMLRLLEELRSKYDYIIIDTPPLGSVIDSAIVARECDGVAIVISADTISYKFAQKVKNQLETSGCKILGVILNKVKRKGGSYGYYGRYYGKYYTGE